PSPVLCESSRPDFCAHSVPTRRSSDLLDEIQGVAHLVGAVDAQLDLPGALRAGEGDAQALCLSAALLARGHSDERATRTDQLRYTVDEVFGRRSRAETHQAGLGEIGEGGARSGPLGVVLGHREWGRLYPLPGGVEG